MLAEQRREEILKIVKDRKTISVPELCTLLNSSESTIRRDLVLLDRQNRLVRLHGGAALPEKQFVMKDELFADKYELLASLIEDLKKELSIALEENKKDYKSPKDYYMEVIILLLSHISSNIDIYNAILKKNNNSIVIDMLYDTLIKNISNELDKTERTTDIPLEIVTKFYVTAVTNICLDYIRYPKKYKRDVLINYLDILIPNVFY